VVGGPERQRFLIISNGHGEDWIAAALVARIRDWAIVEAYPMIGSGTAYAGLCPIVGPRGRLKSGGARTAKGSLRRDLRKGGLAIIPPILKFLRSVRGKYDQIVVVGDMVVPTLAWLTGLRDLIYIDCYKTGAARLYSASERFVAKRVCKTVFCRAENLAAILRADGVDAHAPGNLMMDSIPVGDYDAAARRQRPSAVMLLPGSRGETAENFARQVAALQKLPDEMIPDVFAAVAGDISVDDMAEKTGLRRANLLGSDGDDLGQLIDDRIVVNLLRGQAMGNALAQADVVLSQAGTATVQALGLGRPVIHMTSPKDRRSRFQDEQALFGDARIAVPSEPDAVSNALITLLKSKEERDRLGAIGRERIGGPGAIEAILNVLRPSM
jgi:uncharacterized protein (TIGR03492 family)